LVAGMLAFSVIIILISAVLSKRRDRMDRSETATYRVLIGWGSLLWGLFLAKYAR
jgi:hypothetical protein